MRFQDTLAAKRNRNVSDVVKVIEPRRGWIPIDWAELFEYRELLYFLVWRDVKIR